MTRYPYCSIATCLVICTLSLSAAQAATGSAEILEALHVSPANIERLENGEILASSDAAYESTKRELSADAMAIIGSDLNAVLEALRESTTLIPVKTVLDHAEIFTEADFADVKFTEAEFSEVKTLFDAKPYKEMNLSNSENAMLLQQLQPYRNNDRASKITAASDAMRALLIARYNEYQAKGLDGIPRYRRSKRKQIDLGRALQMTTGTFEPFEEDFPEFVHVMGAYPIGSECCEHHFRWLKVEIRKRPAFALAHTIIQKTDDFILLTERHYYISNTLNSVQITLAWLPYGEGTVMGIAISASADILDSVLGRALRPLGRNKAKDLVEDAMRDISAELQGEGDR